MKKILVIGPGAIGGSLAAYIKKSGHDITLVCNRDTTRDLINERGIQISGVLGDFTIPINSVTSVKDLKEKYDIVFIATKAYLLEKIATEVLPYLKDDSKVISLQNGICLEILANVVGEKRAVGCIIGYGSTMVERGHINVTSTGEFIIGNNLLNQNNELEEVKKVMESMFKTTISNNIYEELYSKLIVNSCITSIGAVCGLTLGKMMKRYDARVIFLKIMEEATIVAEAMGITIPPYGGKLNFHKLVHYKNIFGRLKEHIVIMVVGMKYRRLKSSSLQSLERGELTEIDYFNGYISNKGKEVGVKTLVNDRIVEMIKEIENKKRTITTSNLKELVKISKEKVDN